VGKKKGGNSRLNEEGKLEGGGLRNSGRRTGTSLLEKKGRRGLRLKSSPYERKGTQKVSAVSKRGASCK